MKKILQSLIDVVDSLEAENEERNQGELPYLRLLSIDLSHALKNYERRYDALDQIEPDEVEENDVD